MAPDMGTPTVAVAGGDGDSAIEPRVRQRLALTRTEALHEKGLAAYVTTLVVAVLLLIGVGDQVSGARRLTWMTMVVTLTAVRVLFLHYRSRPAPGAGIRARRFALGAAASG